MKKIRLYLSIAILFTACQASKVTSSKVSSFDPGPVLFTIDSTPVYLDEFKYLYEKNYSRDSSLYSEKSLNEYLDLFTKFKLKVHDAFQREMDQEPAFKQEFGSYQKQLAQPYLTDRSYSEKLVEEAYDRMKQEVSASHILIQASLAASPSDTLKAYKKALELKKKIEAGADFAQVAKESSEDPSAEQNGGYLGYFTGMQMVYAFESAAYNAPIGEVYGPVRTSFGYHLIKVHDRRPSNGEVKVAHIMIRASEDASPEVNEEAKKKIDEIYGLLQKGENWEKMARQFSEDQRSRFSGGVMDAFSIGQRPEPFAEAAFKLKPGEYSEPVRTAFGWHIIKMIERTPVPSFDEMKGELQQKISKDSRSEVSRKRFVERLKAENNFVEKSRLNEKVFNGMDTALIAGKFTPVSGDSQLDKTMFTIGTQEYKVNQYYAFVQGRQTKRESITAPVYARELYQQFVERSMIDYEEEHLPEKNDEYRRLLKEYREGILLFSIMEQEVWNKAVQDEEGQKAFFEENIDNYQWGERVDARIFSFASDSLRQLVKTGLESGQFNLQLPGVPTEMAFGHRSSIINSELEKDLARVMAALVKDTTLSVTITADYISREWKGLAQKRLDKIKTYLLKSGVKEANMTFGAINRFSGNLPKGYKKGGRVYFDLTTTQFEKFREMANQQNPLAIQVQEDLFEKGKNPTLDNLEWKEGVYENSQEDRFGLVQILEVLEPQAKQLNETRGQVISDYQEALETEWIAELKQKYPVKLNEGVFNELIKH